MGSPISTTNVRVDQDGVINDITAPHPCRDHPPRFLLGSNTEREVHGETPYVKEEVQGGFGQLEGVGAQTTAVVLFGNWRRR